MQMLKIKQKGKRKKKIFLCIFGFGVGAKVLSKNRTVRQDIVASEKGEMFGRKGYMQRIQC
jgi:hypothetical protein